MSGTLDEADKRELQEFRRQAEMTKLRAEVRAAMEAERGESDSVPAASTPKVSRTTRVTAQETLTPKTCRILAAESRVYQDGETKQLITEASTWEQVSDQLSALPVAEVKALLRQFCPHEQLPSRHCQGRRFRTEKPCCLRPALSTARLERCWALPHGWIHGVVFSGCAL